MTRAPRAIRLDHPGQDEILGDGVIRHGDVAILPESEPIDPVEPVAAPSAKRGFSWGSLFVAGLSGFLALAAGVWVENTISALMSQNPVLGYAALVCAAVAALALLVMLARVIRDILRERKVEALRERATLALAAGTPDEGRAITDELVGLYASRAQTAQAGRRCRKRCRSSLRPAICWPWRSAVCSYRWTTSRRDRWHRRRGGCRW